MTQKKKRRYGPGSSSRTMFSLYHPDEDVARAEKLASWMHGQLVEQQQVGKAVARRREQQASKPWGGHP